MTGFIRPQTSYRTIFTEPDVHVFEANDLPSPSGGTITLEKTDLDVASYTLVI